MMGDKGWSSQLFKWKIDTEESSAENRSQCVKGGRGDWGIRQELYLLAVTLDDLVHPFMSTIETSTQPKRCRSQAGDR
jgi:hypothetical protein